MKDEQRTQPHRKNPRLEDLLGTVNSLLRTANSAALERYHESRHPIILVVGAPRSGTTLISQWLANSGSFGYPSNLMSRFYEAPVIGALLHQLLLDERFAFKEEMAGLDSGRSLESELGKTAGASAPNEFWYFWRRFLPNHDLEPIGARQPQVDITGLRRELEGVAAAFDKPLVMKGMMLQYDIPFLAPHLPTVIFLHIQRDVRYCSQSLLKARERYFGRRDLWYSSKPPEFEELQHQDPLDQVVGQVVHTQRRIQAGLRTMPRARWIEAQYEAFCDEPAKTWSRLSDCVASGPSGPLPDYSGPASFTNQNRDHLDSQDLAELEKALRRAAL